MGGKCLIIANPISGLGFGRRSAPKLEAALRERGIEPELVWTTESGTARRTAERAGPDVSAILCVGGDGTLNEVVNGVGDRGIPVTIFPTGTGNVLAKEYGIPYSVPRVCDMIERGKIERLDVGLVAGRRFVLFAGAGFDAAVAVALREQRVGRISMLSYIGPTLKALATYRFPQITVSVDGREVGRAGCVLVSNVRSYGGPIEFTADADPTDGLFDVCLLQGRTRWAMVRYLWGGMSRSLPTYKDTAYVKGRVIELVSEGTVPLQADGDVIGQVPVRIELLPARLPVIVP